MTAAAWPGSPADNHVTLLNTIGAIGLVVIVVFAAIVVILLALQVGQDHSDRQHQSVSIEGFTDEWIPENADVADDVARIDNAMVQAVVERERWGS